MKPLYTIALSLTLITSLSGQNVVQSLKDRAGNIWFSVSERGIYRFDGRTFSKFTGQLDDGTSVSACVYQDMSGDLWFRTSDGGICRYNGKTFSRFVFPLPDSSVVGHDKYALLARNPIETGAMLQDREGNFWFLTMNHGIYHYRTGAADPTTHYGTFTQFFVGESSTPWPICIAEDKSGGIIVGCWDGTGAHYYDGKEFISLRGLSDGMIGCITVDDGGNIWLGTRLAGVDRWDGRIQPGGKVSVTNFGSSLRSREHDGNCSLSIFEDSRRNMWFATNWNNLGLRGDAILYNGKTFTNITGNATAIKHADFAARSFAEDRDGNIWIGSKNGILLRYDGTGLTDFSHELTK
jgi:ligand-binding sensor domain-containing protein